MAEMMIKIIELTAVMFTSVFSHVQGMVMALNDPGTRKTHNALLSAVREWLPAWASIALVTLVAIIQPKGLNTIGINPDLKTANFAAAVEGFCWFAGVLILFFFLYRFVLGKKSPNEFDVRSSDRPEIVSMINIRDGLERFVYLSILPVGVIAEEFVYRGYLVLLWGERSGNVLLWGALSVGFSIIVHLYQGINLRNLCIHFVLAASLTAITILTNNLLAAITGHLFNNLAFTLNTWRLADNQELVPDEKSRTKMQEYLWIVFACINFALVISFFAWALEIRFSVS